MDVFDATNSNASDVPRVLAPIGRGKFGQSAAGFPDLDVGIVAGGKSTVSGRDYADDVELFGALWSVSTNYTLTVPRFGMAVATFGNLTAFAGGKYVKKKIPPS